MVRQVQESEKVCLPEIGHDYPSKDPVHLGKENVFQCNFWPPQNALILIFEDDLAPLYSVSNGHRF